jgi:hypothetical protein
LVVQNGGKVVQQYEGPQITGPVPGATDISPDSVGLTWAGVSEAEARSTNENIPLALIGWSAGCATIWSALFTLGSFLYGDITRGFVILGVFVVSGLVLIRVINRLWANKQSI